MKRSLSKKSKKVIEENLEELKAMPPLRELTRIGARMMLQVALEEEITANLERDYYERATSAKGSRNGSKPRTVKIGSGDIGIKMPQVRNAEGPFHSLILPPRVTQMDEIQEIIPLLYMNGLSSRKVKKAVGKLIGQKGLSHQNVMRISGRVVEEFNVWKKRDLSALQVIYLILDGIRLGVRAADGERGGAGSMGVYGGRQQGACRRIPWQQGIIQCMEGLSGGSCEEGNERADANRYRWMSGAQQGG